VHCPDRGHDLFFPGGTAPPVTACAEYDHTSPCESQTLGLVRTSGRASGDSEWVSSSLLGIFTQFGFKISITASTSGTGLLEAPRRPRPRPCAMP
jgi:hypothetical protein